VDCFNLFFDNASGVHQFPILSNQIARNKMSIERVGITKGELRAEPNGEGFNVWVGATSRNLVSIDEAIEFFKKNTTVNQQNDRDAVIAWLEDQRNKHQQF
jgi:hypothetical protein